MDIGTILEKIKNIIKTGSKTKKIDAITAEVEFFGKKQSALIIMPYGMHYNAPNKSLGYIFQNNAKEEDLHVLFTDPDNSDDNLNEKEVSYGIPELTARVKFKADGTINIKILEDDVTDYAVRFNELESRLDELQNNINTITVDVVGVQAGASTITSSVPKVPSNVDWSNCKVNKVNLPAVGEE